MQKFKTDLFSRYLLQTKHICQADRMLAVSAANDLYNYCKYKQCSQIAREQISQMLESNSNDAYCLSLLILIESKARCRLLQGQMSVRMLLQESIWLNPYNTQSVKLLITVNMEVNKFKEAERFFSFSKQFFELLLWDPYKAFSIFYYESQAKGYAMAHQIFQKIERQPQLYYQYYRAYYFYARIKFLCFQFEDCISLLQKDLQYDQEHFFTLRWLIRTAFLLQDNDKAIRYCVIKKAQQSTFNDAIIVAACLIRKGLKWKARAIVNKLESLHREQKLTTSTYIVCYIGICYYLKRYKRAIQLGISQIGLQFNHQEEKNQLILILMLCYRKTRNYIEERKMLDSLCEYKESLTLTHPIQRAKQAISLSKYCYKVNLLEKGRYFVKIAQKVISYVKPYNPKLSSKISKWLCQKQPIKGALLMIFY